MLTFLGLLMFCHDWVCILDDCSIVLNYSGAMLFQQCPEDSVTWPAGQQLGFLAPITSVCSLPPSLFLTLSVISWPGVPPATLYHMWQHRPCHLSPSPHLCWGISRKHGWYLGILRYNLGFQTEATLQAVLRFLVAVSFFDG